MITHGFFFVLLTLVSSQSCSYYLSHHGNLSRDTGENTAVSVLGSSDGEAFQRGAGGLEEHEHDGRCCMVWVQSDPAGQQQSAGKCPFRATQCGWEGTGLPLPGLIQLLFTATYKGTQPCSQPVPGPHDDCRRDRLHGSASSLSLSVPQVCGPTIPKECDGLTLYGGMCFSISQSLSVRGPVPATLRDCQSGIDIVFLLDGSASLSPYQFITMKKFVINLIKKFIAKDTQFAIAQYSSGYETPLNFEQFNHHKEGKDWEKEIMNIQQEMTSTYTAKAINTTVFELFTESAGARPHASRVLLVITDGVSDDKENLKPAVENAAKKNIIRFAIGVGHVSDEELKIIASEPVEKHKFKVSDFRALDGLKETLEKNIVSVEGGGGSTKLEMAQEGFSGAPYHSPEEGIVMGFVGAYQWRGGYQKYNISGGHSDFQKANLLETNGDDSYLGYSLTVALRNSQRYVILGAPRYRHKGVVVVFHPSGIQTSLEKEDQQSQIGAYFGAEVCVVDLDGDSNTDLILASAPMHTEGGREGRVFVYQFFEEDSTVVSDAGVSLLGMEGQRGRFGSSLASLADLNGDGIRDVAVGAPLEDNGQGSVYIFNGRTRGVNPKYSQRIAGSSVQSGLRFFGLTVAQSALDQSGDGLPDIAVGSKGAVLLLRSRPVVSVETEVFYSPSKIPTRVSNCSEPLSVNATVCFLMSRVTAGSTDLRAKLSYTFTLDHVRQTPRATFAPNQHATSDSITATLQKSCLPLSFATHGCPEDALNPIANRVAFTFDGLPITGEGNLRPRLSTDSRLISYHMLNFEIDCGPDKICEDNLRVDFNFSGATHIDVGVAQDLYVTVMVENRGENSYNTRVSLSYPDGLSYRTFTKTQGRVACSSRDGEDGVAPGKTTCSINKPIFTAGDTAVFVVQYGVPDRPTFDQSVSFTANLTSGNDLHAPDSRHFAETEIGVRHSIHVVIRRHENTTGYVTFKADESSVERPVTQLLQVENGNRRLNLSVMIRVPVKLGKMDIWSDMKALSIAGCQRSHDMKPTTDLPVETLKKTQIMNCSVAACRVFKCDVYLKKKDCVFYKISGKVHSGWISQTGVRSGQIILVSESNLEYDSNKYILPSADGLQSSSFTMLGTQVEVYEEPKFTKEITGGVLGGLLLLILVTVGLVKVGFFTSQYTQRLQESANDN
ncbi:integrin alpha-X-like isoform X4 [Clupea harengus]|uniref:Integrin alpha-X-like isoform X4 n=1 Tax=Clupea harengus TaxID=7950 RepID=A0A6P8F8R2_CLUHA|nr:integrin alpha-X-like isoform X4 [Clupea harengus]